MTARLKLKAPFPAIGGKSRVAELIWRHIGDVDNAIEPFCFSAAWLLARPHPPRIETINDENHFVANFWRATQHDPEAVAAAADRPVSEVDLHAMHRYLVLGSKAEAFRQRMREDIDYFDAKRAGLWVAGACMWIGSGWCVSPRELERHANQPPGLMNSDSKGRCEPPPDKRPVLATENGGAQGGQPGKGIHAGLSSGKPPILTGRSNADAAKGVHRKPSEQLPDLTGRTSTGNRFVHKGLEPSLDDNHRPQLADAFSRGRGVHGNDAADTCARRRAWLVDWFSRLRDRLRTVRVCCGDWTRVCTSDSVTTRLGLTGIFLDPPYSHDVARMHAWIAHFRAGAPEPAASGAATNRSKDLYSQDRTQDVDRLVAEVHGYCLQRGADPRIRIVLAGYQGEHEALEAHGWSVIAYKGAGGYGNRSEAGKANAARERLWTSPHCVQPDAHAGPLFAGLDLKEDKDV